MMRRRALCAASAAGGGDAPTFEFPVYISADYCEDSGMLRSYDCYSESLGADFYSSLYDYLVYILKKYGEYWEHDSFQSWWITDVTQYGIYIYVDVIGEWSLCSDLEYYDGHLSCFHELGGGHNYVDFLPTQIVFGYQN